MARPLPQRFYLRHTVTVARELLGCEIRVRSRDGRTRRGRIVEVEAYRGFSDRACHGRRGETPRLRTLFGRGGQAFVYITYGIHHMLNAVTEESGFPSAVLIRALDPRPPGGDGRGPGRLTRTLGVTRRHDGSDLRRGLVRIYPGGLGEHERLRSSTRVGVEYAGPESAALPWRFFIDGHPHLSRGRPTDPARAGARRDRSRGGADRD